MKKENVMGSDDGSDYRRDMHWIIYQTLVSRSETIAGLSALFFAFGGKLLAAAALRMTAGSDSEVVGMFQLQLDSDDGI